jgi:hypothetical protein
MHFLLRLALLVGMLSTAFLLSSCSQSSECDEADCVCMGTCRCLPGDELTADSVDVRPLYTVDGTPVVVLRLDLAGQCFGEGERTFVIYRTTSLEITSGPVDLDDFRAPNHVPESFAYEYMGLTIEVRDISAAGVMLEFVDPTGAMETLVAQCDGTSGVLSCTQL